MLAYTGIETVSNLAEEARDPVRSIPSSIRLVATPSSRSTSRSRRSRFPRCRSRRSRGSTRRCSAFRPRKGGFANATVLGVVQNLGLSSGLAHALEIYVGILAATILFIATNAGVIGASRVTYAMANYRQLPDVFRRLHRRFRTPG